MESTDSRTKPFPVIALTVTHRVSGAACLAVLAYTAVALDIRAGWVRFAFAVVVIGGAAVLNLIAPRRLADPRPGDDPDQAFISGTTRLAMVSVFAAGGPIVRGSMEAGFTVLLWVGVGLVLVSIAMAYLVGALRKPPVREWFEAE
ncbi:hypothetical protein GCM10022243_39390 [Saccharothrix violaceirubra]|uniref:Uncharacterized protein n=1 Tax=Saccharothrix violaceirubra TaxID=413306 RepID=A0A7W7WUW7_9PSEU|nr:hypothetical protein [Saccharothrix violaceirubra]MBB4964277.1 hypothetical protein [Saccharothrix violaceirubra]